MRQRAGARPAAAPTPSAPCAPFGGGDRRPRAGRDLALPAAVAIALVAALLGPLPAAAQARAPEATDTVVGRDPGLVWTLRWGAQRPDLLRFNRVEGPSIGVRGQMRVESGAGPLSMTLTGRLGGADRIPNGAFELVREDLRSRFALSAFHELTAVDERTRAFSLANTATALLFGRDNGDYFRRSGAAVAWSPPDFAHRSFVVRAYAERHWATRVGTDVSLWHATSDTWMFRENLQADEGWEVGASAQLHPRWGSDPRYLRGGLDVRVRGAVGHSRFVRASLEGDLTAPLAPSLDLMLEGGFGTSGGDLPAQRRWFLGGPTTLRGYAPLTLSGSTYARVRSTLRRRVGFGALFLFGDLGWAGDSSSDAPGEHRSSAGVGVWLVDGLIRIDAAWGWSGARPFRVDLVLDEVR